MGFDCGGREQRAAMSQLGEGDAFGIKSRIKASTDSIDTIQCFKVGSRHRLQQVGGGEVCW